MAWEEMIKRWFKFEVVVSKIPIGETITPFEGFGARHVIYKEEAPLGVYVRIREGAMVKDKIWRALVDIDKKYYDATNHRIKVSQGEFEPLGATPIHKTQPDDLCIWGDIACNIYFGINTFGVVGERTVDYIKNTLIKEIRSRLYEIFEKEVLPALIAEELTR